MRTTRSTRRVFLQILVMFPMIIGNVIMMGNKLTTLWVQDEAPVNTVSSPVCHPTWGPNRSEHPITRIYLLHMRKAGGSTMRVFFRALAKRFNLTVDTCEGCGHVEDPSQRNDTLYVTHLRDPVARALSHYRYEGRWNCKDGINHIGNFTPSAENAASLDNFLQNETSGWKKQKPKVNQPCLPEDTKRRLWVCAKNCYIRWASQEFNCLRNLTVSYESALDRLRRYHLIVNIDRFQESETYVDGLASMFGNYNKDILEKGKGMYCQSNSRAWNKQFPPEISPNSMERLRKANTEDSRLYSQLTTCPDRIEFPSFSDSFLSRREITTKRLPRTNSSVTYKRQPTRNPLNPSQLR